MVAALLVGSATAMVVTQDLRDEGSVVSLIRWKKRPGPRYRVCFRLTRDDAVEVSAVNASGEVVRMLAPRQDLQGGDTAHCFDWDGRTTTGQAAPPGPYRLQVDLERANRVAVSGERLNISAARAATTSGAAP